MSRCSVSLSVSLTDLLLAFFSEKRINQVEDKKHDTLNSDAAPMWSECHNQIMYLLLSPTNGKAYLQ